MFENLLDLVKSNAGDAVIKNTAVPNEQNEAVINHASGSIVESLKNQLAGGNFNELLSTLGGKSGLIDNPVIGNLVSSVSDSLMSKFGLSTQAAASVSTQLVPNVMTQLVKKTNDPSDSSFDLGSIFNTLSDGKTKDWDLNKLLSGGVNLQDVAGKLSSTAMQGGVSGMLGNLFGK